MPDCTWDPKKHNNKSCPMHSGKFFIGEKKRVLNALKERNSNTPGAACYRQGFKKAFQLYNEGQDFNICFGNFGGNDEYIGHMWLSDIDDANKLIFEGKPKENEDKRNALIIIPIRQIDGYDENELEEYLESEIEKIGE